MRSRRSPAFGLGGAGSTGQRATDDGSKAAVPANCSGNLPDQRFEISADAMVMGDRHGALLQRGRQLPQACRRVWAISTHLA